MTTKRRKGDGKHCTQCGVALPEREPGMRGAKPKYCSDRCRKLPYERERAALRAQGVLFRVDTPSR